MDKHEPNPYEPNPYEPLAAPDPAPAEPPAERPLPEPRKFGVRDLMILVALAAVVVWLGINAGAAMIATLAVLMTVAAVAGFIAVLLRGPSTRSEALLWVVANAAERQLPLEPGIEACGDLCGGSYRVKARALAHWLRRGLSLPEAISRVPGVFPAAGFVFTRMNWDRDRLALSLRDLIRSRAEWRPYRRAAATRFLYLIWTILVMQLIGGFALYWILPLFEEIFIDFGVELPLVTRWLVISSGFMRDFWPLALVPLLELVLIPLIPLLFFDPMHWNIGPFDRFTIRRHGALVLRVLAGEVAMGRPMDAAFGTLCEVYPSGLVRRRMTVAWRRVRQGGPWSRSLVRAGLIRGVDAAVLDAAQGAGNLEWALRHVAEGLERRAGIRAVAAAQVLYPAAVLLVGGAVFLFAAAFLMPLFQLIRELAG